MAITACPGRTATVTDSTLVTTDAWTEWKIPLSSFTGVTLSQVKKLYVGVGDRSHPTAGAGKLYFDDIGVGHPAQ